MTERGAIPAAKGEPVTGVSVLADLSIAKTKTSFELKFATYAA